MPDGNAGERARKLRQFFARLVTARGDARDPRIERAFASVPRETFAGPAPWFIAAGATGGPTGYLRTPDDDPAFLYQDVLIGLDPARGINMGEPSLHARCLDALAPAAAERVVQVGAGSGYYTAIIACLVGPDGHVDGFEIDPVLAARAEHNLEAWNWASIEARSGTAADLPAADAIYVNAGLTQPSENWLRALRPGGRLLFPLQPADGFGGMLLMRKPAASGLAWPARFVSRAGFIACEGQQDRERGRGLGQAFSRGGWATVRSVRLGGRPDETCWYDGGTWWLSTRQAGSG